MKTMAIFLALFVAVSVILTCCLSRKYEQVSALKQEIAIKAEERFWSDVHTDVVLGLLNPDDVWYVIDEHNVSSKPDRKGKCVHLGSLPGDKLTSILRRDKSDESVGYVQYPAMNTQITFTPSGTGNPFPGPTTAGGLLTYDYVKPNK